MGHLFVMTVVGSCVVSVRHSKEYPSVVKGTECYVRIPKESGRCQKRRVGGRKRVRPIAIDYRTVAGTAGVEYKGDRRSKGPDGRSPEWTPTALRRHKGEET